MLDNDLINKSSEPFIFIASSIELQNYFKAKAESRDFISYLPIYLDATCNGLQHLAAILKDAPLGEMTNLTPSSLNDNPKDLYSSLIPSIKKSIEDVVQLDNSLKDLLLIPIDRKFIKRSIMTISYNVTVRGVFEQLITDFFILCPCNPNNLEEIDSNLKFSDLDFKPLYRYKLKSNENIIIGSKVLFELSKIIRNSLYTIHNNLQNYVNFIEN